MKKLLLLPLALASAIVFAQNGAVTPEMRKTIQDRYTGFTTAYVKEDIETLGKFVGKSFVHGTLNSDRKMDRKGFLEAVDRGFKGSKYEKFDVKILVAEKKGEDIVVVIVEEIMQESERNPGQKVLVRQVTRDTWTREDGQWVVSHVDVIGGEFERVAK